MSLDPAVKSVTSLSCINDFYSCKSLSYAHVLHVHIIKFICFSTDLMYVAGSDRSLHVYDMNVMKWVWSVQDAHKRPINCIGQNKVQIM